MLRVRLDGNQPIEYPLLEDNSERADPETIKWAETNLKVPVYDHWWQTETGWPICGNPVGLGAMPVKYGSPTVPMPGYDLQVLDADGKPVGPGETGTLAIKLPLPPSCLPTLWENDKGFRESYLAELTLRLEGEVPAGAVPDSDYTITPTFPDTAAGKRYFIHYHGTRPRPPTMSCSRPRIGSGSPASTARQNGVIAAGSGVSRASSRRATLAVSSRAPASWAMTVMIRARRTSTWVIPCSVWVERTTSTLL